MIMTQPLEAIRVLEVGNYGLVVPMVGMHLAHLGARPAALRLALRRRRCPRCS